MVGKKLNLVVASD